MPARLLTTDNLPHLVDALASAPRVAIDTEFHAERRYVPKLFLVQIHIPGDEAWIVDPLMPDVLDALAAPLRGVPWIVHGGSQDIRLLARALGGVPEEVLDTQIGAALLCERYPEGYGTLVQRFLGRTLPKASTLSDWSRRPLSPDQLKYAVDDVLRLPDLWGAIEHRLVERGRLDVAKLACADARARSMVESDPNEAWRRFAAAPGMTPRARSILQELTAWREAVAQERNQPARTLLGDGTIVELAKRPPATQDGILANRRFPRSAQKHIAEIWAAVERGRQRTDAQAPACPERYSGPWRSLHVLRAWAVQLGHELALSPTLVLDGELLDALALDPPTSRPVVAERLGPWRDALVGDATWAWFCGSQKLGMIGSDSTLSPAAP
jgi:ribonuclease D